MSARLDPHWTYHGLPAVRMENRYLAVEVLPDCGGKILRLIDKHADRNVLWENARVTPHRAPLFANFDDHWPGGWDEIFPGAPASVDRYGEPTPYMGELWAADGWRWRVLDGAPGQVRLECSVQAPITPARYTRVLTLDDDAPVLRADVRLEHVGTRPFDYCLGTHPSLAVTPHHRFDVPAATAEVGDAGGQLLLGERGDRYAWPHLRRRDGGQVDVGLAMGPEAQSFALHGLTGLAAGWAACTDTAARRGFGLVFDEAVFRVVWLWLVYGGWRGYYHAAMEAWTSWPGALADAVAAGTARTLNAGESLETTVYAVVYGGVEAVGELRADGTVTAATADG